MSGVPIERSFYTLAFPAQMIVWATRKRLHLRARGADDSNVAHAFHLAGLDELYAALMSIVDVLTCGVSRRIQLHGVACPCLDTHEVSLLNALAYLQRAQKLRAQACMAKFLGTPAVRLVLPAMHSVVRELDALALQLPLLGEEIDPTKLTADRGIHRVH